MGLSNIGYSSDWGGVPRTILSRARGGADSKGETTLGSNYEADFSLSIGPLRAPRGEGAAEFRRRLERGVTNKVVRDMQGIF